MLAVSITIGRINATEEKHSDHSLLHIYNSVIAPILIEKCVSCHNADSMQGGLDLSNPNGIVKGGAFGAVIQPGSADASEMIRRITLPDDDVFAMPPADKDRVSKEDTVLLTWWINNGASFNETQNKDTLPDEINEALLKKNASISNIDKINHKEVPHASEEVIQTVRRNGFEVRQLAINHPMLDVAINPLKQSINQDELASLALIQEQIIWLNLSKCELDDALFTSLPPMPNVVKLNVSQNKLTNKSVQLLGAFPNIESINLYKNAVDDAAIHTLQRLSKLRTVYLWQTNVTVAAIQQLQASKPHIKIVTSVE